LAVLFLACVPIVNAEVDFDDLRVNVVEDSLSVGDPLKVKVTFDNPDTTGIADFDLKIVVDDVTVYTDEGRETSFTRGEDKTLTISSDDFPGPDQDNDYWNVNLMNRQCGSHSVEVYASDGDLARDLQDSDDFTIGDDDKILNMDVSPEKPLIDNKTIITVIKASGTVLSGATVKVTWIDDPDGDSDGEWDSADKKWQSKTDGDGEVNFKVSDKFDDNAYGIFQVDAYYSGYCLSRQTFEVSKNQLFIAAKPQDIQGSGTSVICVTDSAGASVYNAQLYVSGPSYSKTYYSLSDGCYHLTLNSQGAYTISANKAGYESAIGYPLTVSQPTTTTTTSTIKITYTTTTLMKAPAAALVVTSPKQAYAGEPFEVIATTSDGMPVSGVKVTVSQQDINALTDDSGIVSLNIAQPGAYTIRAEKQNYLPAAETLEVIDKVTSAPGQGAAGGSASAAPKSSSDSMLLIGALVGALVTVLIGVVAVLLFTQFSHKPAKKTLFDVSDDSKLGEAK